MLGTQFGSIADTLLLFALGIGYIVLYLARREEKGLRLVGYAIGGGIIVLALLYILSSLLFGVCYKSNIMRHHRTMMQQKMMQQR